jgi:hypothetical protein
MLEPKPTGKLQGNGLQGATHPCHSRPCIIAPSLKGAPCPGWPPRAGRLEPELWNALREIGIREGASLVELTARAVRANPGSGRTNAVPVFAIGYFRDAAAMNGMRCGR